MKNILIISSSPRKKGNSQILCEQFKKGAEAKGHQVEIVRIMEQNIGFCRACDGCMRNGGTCVLKDDMAEILEMFQKADVLVLATPVYFFGISAQMKTFIDRTYPIWQHLGKKEVYYIISAGLGEDIIERSLGDLDGFVEHLEEYKIAGKIYAANVMDAGLVRNQSVFKKAYDMGYSVQNAGFRGFFVFYVCYLCCRHTLFTCACPVFCAGTADSCKDGACNIMPYTENSTWKSCQWIGYKVSCCQRNCQSAVLHAHFNSYSCCPCIFYMENFCCKKS